ncbi:MAG: hypothetical protein OWT27_03035, partial [Firmicutes bacterium]|nr:hypothetical protein [Bacillota bacterium]
AGEYPTASSVIEDLVEVLRAPSLRGHAFVVCDADMRADDEEEQGAFYSRMDFAGLASQRADRMAEFARRLSGRAVPIAYGNASESTVSYVFSDVSMSEVVAAAEHLSEIRLLIPLSQQLFQQALDRCAVS